MERRFTLKDFFLFATLGVVLLAVITAMVMVDRQWQMMAGMRATMTEQAEDLRALRSDLRGLDARLAQGIVSSPPSSAPSTPEPGAFRRAALARAQGDFAEGDWFVRAFGVSLKTLTPLISSDKYSSDVQSYVLESLLIRDADTLEWQGLIAESWSTSEDGLAIRFRLRDGVRFSDGKPLTADDVRFTFEFTMNDAIAAPRQRAYLEKVASVEVLGPLEVEFRFSEPYFNALSLAGSMGILARHFYEPFLDTPNDFNESRGLLLGSGPYRLADPRGWTPDGNLVELERNPRYWGAVAPPFDRLLWKVIENDSARLTTFRNGDIDRYDARAREYHDLRDDTVLAQRAQRFEFMNPIGGYSYVGWNQRRDDKPTRFADPRVRLAMTLLTNRPGIIEEIMLGYAELAMSPFNPRSPQHNPDLAPHPYDPDRAIALLAEAGYRDRDGDGVLEGPDGTPFEFEVTYFQDSQDTRRIVLYLKDLYARAGIVLKPLPSEWSVMLEAIKSRGFDAITLGWTSGIETDVYQMFHGKQTEDNGDNFIHFKNAEFDRLVDEARATVDESKRMPLWHQVERIFHDEQPYTFLMRRKTLAFVDRRLSNLEVTRLGLNLELVPVESFVPTPVQRYRQ